MTLPVVWLLEAHAELKEAQARYAGVRPELGQLFVHAAVETIERITEGPCITPS